MGSTERRRGRAEQGDGARLRSELVEAARHVLATEGRLEALTLRRIAREVGVSAPSIYLHFDSREQLADAAVAAQFDRLRRATVESAGLLMSPEGHLREILAAYARFAQAEGSGFSVLFTSDLLQGATAKASSNAALRVLVDAVSACLDDPDTTKAGELAHRTWAYLHGLMSLRIALPDMEWPSLPHAIDQLLLDVGISDHTRQRATSGTPGPQPVAQVPGTSEATGSRIVP